VFFAKNCVCNKTFISYLFENKKQLVNVFFNFYFELLLSLCQNHSAFNAKIVLTLAVMTFRKFIVNLL